jgi:uncharacterized protein (AIM24 family)
MNLIIDTRNFCWSTGEISVTPKATMPAQWLQGQSSLALIKNEGLSQAIIGLAQQFPGKVLEIRSDFRGGLYVLPDVFLATYGVAGSNLSIEMRYISSAVRGITVFSPPAFFSRLYHITGQRMRDSNATSITFLQSCGSILRKHLSANETMQISFSCLVAFEGSCLLNVISNPNNIGNFFEIDNLINTFGVNSLQSSMQMVDIKGPGTVYLCSHTSRKFQHHVLMRGTRRSTGPMGNMTAQNSILGLIFNLLILLSILSVLFVLIMRVEMFEINIMNEQVGGGEL